MKMRITVILAIALLAIPFSAMAHIETWAEYDKRLEKQLAEMQIPMGEKDDVYRITSVEKIGKVIITTMETNGEFGWIAMAEKMGGVEKFKAFKQRMMAEDSLMYYGLPLVRRYTLRYKFVDNGKEVCTVDVSISIIWAMLGDYDDSDNFPEYMPEPLSMEESRKLDEYEKYLKDGGYPPAMTTEEFHRIKEFWKYKKF